MDDDANDFEPKLGRMRRASASRKYLHRILAAATLASGGRSMRSRGQKFRGSRIGRGGGIGAVLGQRDRYGVLRRRRVVIKSRIVRLAGKGFEGAQAHLRYIQRDGTTREGERGELYDALSDKADGRTFLESSKGDRHQFRFIVSAEDAADYEDLKPLTRRLMARMEEDLGSGLKWVAVDHFNTGHPHSHIILRGKDDRGRDLIIARDYIRRGMRERAAELVDLDLGPRTDRAIQDRLRGEVEQERLTSIDRDLLRTSDDNGVVSGGCRDAFDQAVRTGRLRKLERLGLARELVRGQWRLDPGLREILQRMGERGDIIRTMQRAFAQKGTEVQAADLAVTQPDVPIVGTVIERGLSDELHDRHYLIIDATDGRSHYVDIGKSEDEARPGSIVRIEPVQGAVRDVDRTVVAIASKNEGCYDADAHMRHDPHASEAFVAAHVRRLEAVRRLTGGVEREVDGSWIIAPDHLERIAVYEAARVKDRPVQIKMLSPAPLDKLVVAEAATWLDRELVSAEPLALREAGFGAQARVALEARRRWLLGQGLAEEADGEITYRRVLLDVLRRRELLRVAGQLSDELALPFSEANSDSRIEGILRRRVEMLSGRYALIERSHDFTLVPWRPVLERRIGSPVSGIVRGDGVSWTFGRARSGPIIP